LVDMKDRPDAMDTAVPALATHAGHSCAGAW
jgi:hypothetical protein